MALETVEKLRGVEFDRIDTNKHQVGLIAQEVEHIPGATILVDGYLHVNYSLLGIEFKKIS